ncbi:hypothetical protein LWI29_021601 [Acer saccharum]|uniref:PGG domain-containing protein n=1 Tax=Acer saccharum TaxID=4024 RepID=A0AA39SWM6_ACESA|nr:hypothetical protein LWI29_021601 [Acer saccharum]
MEFLPSIKEPYQAVLDEKWEDMEKYYNDIAEDPMMGLGALLCPISVDRDTAFHLAVYSGEKQPLCRLLELVEKDGADGILGLETVFMQNIYGNTVLHEAAIRGNLEAVEILIAKFPQLVKDTNQFGETPLFRAAAFGKRRIVKYLASQPDQLVLTDNGEKHLKNIHRQREDGTSILHAAVQGEHFGCPTLSKLWTDKRYNKFARDLAVKLIEKDKSWEQSITGSTSTLNEAGKDKLLEQKNTGSSTTSNEAAKYKPDTNNDQEKKKEEIEKDRSPLFAATRTGNVELVKMILKEHPQALEYKNSKKQNILHVAVKYRQKEIFKYVKTRKVPMLRLVRQTDADGYTVLHSVADTKHYNRGTRSGPAYNLQEELEWFSNVEKSIPSHYKTLRDNKDKTAKELFKEMHEKQLENAQRWIKETSQSCSGVAVLVATVVFAAAFTVPGGTNDSNGRPILLHSPFFLFFTVMDVVSLSCSLTAVVMFLSVVTSPFELHDFLVSLPRRLTLGFALLFMSVATTMLAFTSTIVLIIHLDQRRQWTMTLICSAAFFPVSVLALTHFPLFVSFLIAWKNLFMFVWDILPYSLVLGWLKDLRKTTPRSLVLGWLKDLRSLVSNSSIFVKSLLYSRNGRSSQLFASVSLLPNESVTTVAAQSFSNNLVVTLILFLNGSSHFFIVVFQSLEDPASAFKLWTTVTPFVVVFSIFFNIQMPQELQDEKNPRKVKRTKAYRRLNGKDMTQKNWVDSSLFAYYISRTQPLCLRGTGGETPFKEDGGEEIQGAYLVNNILLTLDFNSRIWLKNMVQAMIHPNKVAVIPEEKDLLLQLQAPSSTTSVISPQPIQPVGSSITVGCISEKTSLNPAVQVPKKPEEVEEEVESESQRLYRIQTTK